jgi:co-chaperonin GroES (HSP10)
MRLTETYEDPGIDLDNFDKEAEIAKFPTHIPLPLWNIQIRLYTTPKKTTGGLILTDTEHNMQQYHVVTGLVVRVAPGAYKDARYNGMPPACKVGDWVVIGRHSGIKLNYKGMPIYYVKEDAIEDVVEDPRYITK